MLQKQQYTLNEYSCTLEFILNHAEAGYANICLINTCRSNLSRIVIALGEQKKHTQEYLNLNRRYLRNMKV